MTAVVDPLAPCGYCRRCAIHDDPGGCLTVEAYERQQLDSMTNRELVAYWNILQFPGLSVGDALRSHHRWLVHELLDERGIAHEDGKRTVAA